MMQKCFIKRGDIYQAAWSLWRGGYPVPPLPLGEAAFKVPASFCLSHGAFRGLQMFSKWRGGQGGERLRSLMPACVLD